MREIERNDGFHTPFYGLTVVVSTTPKAILVKPKNTNQGPEAVESIWVPRSIISVAEIKTALGLLPHNPRGKVYYCDLPQWFYNQNPLS